MNGLRATLRLAWRDALNSRPRSALIIAMIALPVAAFTALPLIAGTSMIAGGGPEGTAVNALIIAMVVLETVLLAGPAFAVGLRRQHRLLALVSAAGGSPGQLRALVLCSGLLLGGLAGLLGTAFGFLFGWAGRLVLTENRPKGRDLPPWDVPWIWIAAIVLTAVLSGLAAAYVPARQAARTDTAEVMAGRRSVPPPRRGLPVLGAVLIAAGVALVPLGLDALREFSAAFGAALIIIGFVLLIPALIALTARFADRLPLPLRLAVRDADRHRVRTAPAVSAIMAVTAALTALAIGGASDFAQKRTEYEPSMPAGQTIVRPLRSEGLAQQVEAAVERAVPGHRTARVDRLVFGVDEDPEAGTVMSLRCGENPCHASGVWHHPGSDGSGLLVSGPESIPLVLGRDDPGAAAALAEGKVVVFVPDALSDGRVTLDIADFPDFENSAPSERTVRLPAVRAEPPPPSAHAPFALIPPQAAEHLGARALPLGLMIDGPLDPERGRLLSGELEKIGLDFSVYTERGFSESFALPLLVLGVIAAVLVLAGALTATGLAAADSRPDLATLNAVGARPVTRRLLLMAQTGYIAVLGCGLGLLAGAGPGIAVAYPLTSRTEYGGPPHGVIIDVPWLFLLAVLVGVPLVASAVTALSVRGRQILPERSAV
ncbi:FtsX-like permease family protein [Actinocorallia aurantiaca]|uniref:ABC3 transporter permease C-terminal domain-containing protein n=1 Tax=Actinocorallia aurantiaca TaxID=46204 RepID=A0ABN3U7B3_9ACTN